MLGSVPYPLHLGPGELACRKWNLAPIEAARSLAPRGIGRRPGHRQVPRAPAGETVTILYYLSIVYYLAFQANEAAVSNVQAQETASRCNKLPAS